MRRLRPGVRLLAIAAVVAGTITAVGTGSIVGSRLAAGAKLPAKGNIHTIYAGYSKRGDLDCNGDSPVQKPDRLWNCTDIRGFAGVNNANTWGGKFYDNGVYIGHDEPDATFVSSRPGSGNNVSWTLRLGKDPTAMPTDSHPGKDVSHWFELTPAPWLSMAICDPNSYPQLPCSAESDANAPSGRYPGGGSAFMEMQFYPPGFAPFVDGISCDNTHWCAALTIDSLECTDQFAQCNTSCEEPVNAAFIQKNGVPAEPPSPQAYPDNQFFNSKTLFMNPGDKVVVHIWDAPVPGKHAKALEVTIHDLTTGQSGFMQASAKNGFKNTSILNCAGTPFNFQPEYSTAKVGNVIPWAALQTNVSTEFETGHFEPCSSLSDEIKNVVDPDDTSVLYNDCHGAYEGGGPEGPETGDSLCWAKGDTHSGYDFGTGSTPPDEITGCLDDLEQNGDLDFDGTPYRNGEWPTGTSPTSRLPSSFVENLPLTNGHAYSQLFFQTDIALSESICTLSHLSGCTVPPKGSEVSQAGHVAFYPSWSEAKSGKSCVLEFGNVTTRVDTFGKDAEYGTDLFTRIGYPEFEGKLYNNGCYARPEKK